MGLNVNLCRMLGLTPTVRCPNCGKTIKGQLDDYDIESDQTNPKPGIWNLAFYCSGCEHEWHTMFKVEAHPVTQKDKK